MIPRHKKTTKGFKSASALLETRIRQAGETRGFAVSRVLTHWPDIVGEDIAAIARPVDVKYGRQGFGATLTVLTTGAQAPMLEMQKEKLREKVNAVYGYNAISRLRITQTAPTGFEEGQVAFQYRPVEKQQAKPDAAATGAARDLTSSIQDADLRAALENLGKNVLTKAKR